VPPPELLTIREIALRVRKRYDTVLRVVRLANLQPIEPARPCKSGLVGGRYDAAKAVALFAADAPPLPSSRPAEPPPREVLIAGLPFTVADAQFLARQRAERQRRQEARCRPRK
jgi:hypothetical protein